MPKQKKKKGQHHRNGGLMGRSDIPYVQRIQMDRKLDVATNREHAAKIAMMYICCALNESEGIGYKRLVPFIQRMMEYDHEYYSDDPDLKMSHFKRRFEQIGITVSGELYEVPTDGLAGRELEVQQNRVHAMQIALYCGVVAMNDEFGIGLQRQTRVAEKISEYSKRYKKEGEGFLLEKMLKIGFAVDAYGHIRAYVEDDGTVVTPKKWRENNAQVH